MVCEISSHVENIKLISGLGAGFPSQRKSVNLTPSVSKPWDLQWHIHSHGCVSFQGAQISMPGLYILIIQRQALLYWVNCLQNTGSFCNVALFKSLL